MEGRLFSIFSITQISAEAVVVMRENDEDENSRSNIKNEVVIVVVVEEGEVIVAYVQLKAPQS